MNNLLRRCTVCTVAVLTVSSQICMPSVAARTSGMSAPQIHVDLAPSEAHTPPQRIVIPEPARRPPRPFSGLKVRANQISAPAVRPPAGTHVAGYPMLRPDQIDRVLAAARARVRQAQMHHGTVPTPAPATAPRAVAPARARGATQFAPTSVRNTRSVSSSSGTGINSWWRYQGESIAGGGHVMVNVGTGNAIIQDVDMSVPHKGVPLIFQRTYNSQSQHDVAGSDGTPPSLYGNGWTNTFDAHLWS